MGRTVGIAGSVLLLAGLAGAHAPIHAQLWVFEVSRQTFDIDADFDDSILLTGPDFVLNVPALEEVHGLGFAVGAGGEGAFGTLTYMRANPRALSVLGDTIASIRSYGIDVAIAPWLDWTGLSVSPLVRFGGAFTFVKVPGAASDGASLDDAGFNALQFNAGFGGILRISRFAHVSADFSRRFIDFGVGSAYGDKVPIDDGLSGTTNAFTVGVAIYRE